MWYDVAPSEYAKALRFYAERQDECALRKDVEGKPWSAHDAAQYRRAGRRLRAMAILCDTPDKTRAGAIDFRGLSSPVTPEVDELATVEQILATAVPRAA